MSVELLPDDAGEKAIRADWAALERAGIGNAGRHTGSTNRPHVSLSVRPGAGDPEPLRRTVRRLPIAVWLGGLLLFAHDDRVVLARAVLMGARLIELHAEVHRLTSAWGEALPHSAPGAWSPHLTLARRLRLDDVPRAVEALGPGPERLTFDRLRVWDAGRREVTGLYSTDPSGSV